MYKKSAPKKSGTSRKTTKRKTSKSRKSKVYLPASKVIGLCIAIIVICMGLLLVTTVKTHDVEEPAPVSQRFEQNDKTAPDNSKTDDKSKAAADNGKNAGDKTKSPADKTKSPADKTKSPADKTKSQADKTKSPADKTKSTADNSKSPIDNSKSPIDKKTLDNVKPPAETSRPVNENKTAIESPRKEKDNTATSKYNFPKAVNGAQLIFVFDDAGQNNAHLEQFMSLPFPITVAVLPQLPSSVAAADRVRRSGNEVILHQPMQSISDKVNPGPGAITPDMDEAQIITQLFLNINEIGPVAGMNNHEGSAITADAEKMAIILQTASENGIYFLDSRTNVETKVPYVAGELGYTYYERNIFLDNEKTEAFALKELRRGLDIANKNGNVIMIGHIWSADFLPAFLNKVYPELKAAGYTFSTVGNSRAQK